MLATFAFDVCHDVYLAAREVIDSKIPTLNLEAAGKYAWRPDRMPRLAEYVADFALAGERALGGNARSDLLARACEEALPDEGALMGVESVGSHALSDFVAASERRVGVRGVRAKAAHEDARATREYALQKSIRSRETLPAFDGLPAQRRSMDQGTALRTPREVAWRPASALASASASALTRYGGSSRTAAGGRCDEEIPASRMILFRVFYLGGAEYQAARNHLGISELTWEAWTDEVRGRVGRELTRSGVFPPSKYFKQSSLGSAGVVSGRDAA